MYEIVISNEQIGWGQWSSPPTISSLCNTSDTHIIYDLLHVSWSPLINVVQWSLVGEETSARNTPLHGGRGLNGETPRCRLCLARWTQAKSRMVVGYALPQINAGSTPSENLTLAYAALAFFSGIGADNQDKAYVQRQWVSQFVNCAAVSLYPTWVWWLAPIAQCYWVPKRHLHEAPAGQCLSLIHIYPITEPTK